MSKDNSQNRGPGTPQGPNPGFGHLVQLSDFGEPQAKRMLADLRSYWEGLRQGRAIPARAEVEPKGIRRGLDYAFVLERIAPGAARIRLAGRHLVDLLGMEVRGMPICAVLNPSSRGLFSDVLETVFRGPQIAQLSLTSEAGYGRPAMTGHMLILPLKSDLGDVTRALGCVIGLGEIGRAPRRFDLLAHELTPVIPGAEILQPSASAPGFAEPPAPWQPTAHTPLPQSPMPSTPAPDLPPASPEERRARFRVISSDTAKG